MNVVPYEPAWLPQVAALARAHARLAPPWLSLADEEVAHGLEQHASWPFYSRGVAGGQILLAVDGSDVLAAAQMGVVEPGWGYGPAPDDGPEWLHGPHVSLFWLFAWPGWREAAAAAASLAAKVVASARSEGLPGIEAFRGGAGFMPFGTQLSTRWPHLWGPLRAAGFRQPRELLAYTGETAPEGLPAPDPVVEGLAFRRRRGRLEAWWHGEPVGVSAATPLGAGWGVSWPGAARRSGWGAGEAGGAFGDPRAREWCVIRRLVVDESMRGRGIGSALFAEQLRRLHAAGFARYLLHIPADPEELPAQALYGKFGRLADRQQVLRVSF